MLDVILLAVGLAFFALIALAAWQCLRIKSLTRDAAALRQQLTEATALRQENERVNHELRTANQRSLNDFQELLRLRNQVSRNRQVEQENAQLKFERSQLTNAIHVPRPDQQATSEPDNDMPKTPEQRFQRAKGFFGRDLGMALLRATEANGGVIPPEMRGPLFEIVESLSNGGEYDFRARNFELVYQGSLRDVNGSSVILAREREPVQEPDGRWKRLYVIGDGSSQWISSDTRDGFVAREQQLWPGTFSQK